MLEESERAGNKRAPDGPRPKASLRRREYTLDKKLQVVRETLTPGASVSVVARRHDINSNVVFRWRRMYARGELGKALRRKRDKKAPPQAFTPVGVVDQAGVMRALPAPKQNAVPQNFTEEEPVEDGVIEIETAAGVKVRVSGRVDDRTLGLVLAEIRRRS